MQLCNFSTLNGEEGLTAASLARMGTLLSVLSQSKSKRASPAWRAAPVCLALVVVVLLVLALSSLPTSPGSARAPESQLRRPGLPTEEHVREALLKRLEAPSRSFNFENTPSSSLRPRGMLSASDSALAAPFDALARSTLGRPLASVIIPFTCPKLGLVEETFESLRRQTVAQFEVIVVPDGAVECIERVHRFVGSDPRIRIAMDNVLSIHGLPSSRNAGVRAARGEVLIMLDSDDLLEPTVVEKACAFLRAHNASFAKGFTVGFGCVWWTERCATAGPRDASPLASAASPLAP